MLTAENKKEIYEHLLSRQDMVKLGGSYTKHVVIRLLAEGEYTCRKFGFATDDEFLAAMPEFLTVRPGTSELAGMVWVQLHSWEEEATQVVPAPIPAAEPVTEEQPAELENAQGNAAPDGQVVFCRQIYDYLLTQEGCNQGQAFLSSKGGLLLAAGGFDYKANGFKKLTDVFRTMETLGYVKMDKIDVSGGGQQYAINLCVDAASTVSTAQTDAEAPLEQPAEDTAAARQLTREVLLRVRDIVVNKIGFDREIGVGTLGEWLKAEGIDYKDYGFSKLKPFLKELEAVGLPLEERVVGGVQQSFIMARPLQNAGEKTVAWQPDMTQMTKELTEEDKRYLYGVLIRQLAPGQPHLKSTVGQVLRASDIDKEDYGFALLQELLEAMAPEYLTLQEYQTEEGKPFFQVILRDVPGLDTKKSPAAAGTKSLTEAVKRQVYDIVDRELGVADEIGIGTVGLWLLKNGINYEQYGFSKLKPFLKAMESTGLAINERVLGGVSQSFVSIASSKAEEGNVVIEEEDETVDGRRLDRTERQKIYRLLRRRFGTEEQHMATVILFLHENGYKKELYGFPKAKDFLEDLARDFLILREQPMNGVQQTLVTVRDVAAWNTGDAQPHFPIALREPYVFVQKNALDKLRQRLGLDTDDDLTLQLETLEEDYQKAKSSPDGLFEVANKQKAYAYRFALSLSDTAGRSLEGYIGFITVGGSGHWILYQFATKKEPQGEKLQQYADMHFDQFLTQLAQMALPERWGANNRILSSYIRYTFDRLEREGKICESRDRTLTAFNTGLVNSLFDDIYACFEQYCDAAGKVIGREFIGFCTGMEQGLGKRLQTSIRPLPQPASYLTEKEDLLFDLELELQGAEEHILRDNIHRLPLEFLIKQLGAYDDIRVLLEQIKNMPGRLGMADKRLKNDPLYMQLRSLLKQNMNAYNELRVQLKDAIDMARRKVRWNYKIATPCYYPTEDCMCLLLPLALADRYEADTALVVRLYRNTDPYLYRGETILTLPQAYRNARLVSRPNNDWLNERNSAL